VRLFKHKKQEQKENRHSSYYIKNHPDEDFVRKWISKYDSILIDKIAQLEKTTKKAHHWMLVTSAMLCAQSEISFEKRVGAELADRKSREENAALISFLQRMRKQVSGRKEIEPKAKDDQPQSS
jgi:hypothetical protein